MLATRKSARRGAAATSGDGVANGHEDVLASTLYGETAVTTSSKGRLLQVPMTSAGAGAGGRSSKQSRMKEDVEHETEQGNLVDPMDVSIPMTLGTSPQVAVENAEDQQSNSNGVVSSRSNLAPTSNLATKRSTRRDQPSRTTTEDVLQVPQAKRRRMIGPDGSPETKHDAQTGLSSSMSDVMQATKSDLIDADPSVESAKATASSQDEKDDNLSTTATAGTAAPGGNGKRTSDRLKRNRNSDSSTMNNINTNEPHHLREHLLRTLGSTAIAPSFSSSTLATFDPASGNANSHRISGSSTPVLGTSLQGTGPRTLSSTASLRNGATSSGNQTPPLLMSSSYLSPFLPALSFDAYTVGPEEETGIPGTKSELTTHRRRITQIRAFFEMPPPEIFVGNGELGYVVYGGMMEMGIQRLVGSFQAMRSEMDGDVEMGRADDAMVADVANESAKEKDAIAQENGENDSVEAVGSDGGPDIDGDHGEEKGPVPMDEDEVTGDKDGRDKSSSNANNSTDTITLGGKEPENPVTVSSTEVTGTMTDSGTTTTRSGVARAANGPLKNPLLISLPKRYGTVLEQTLSHILSGKPNNQWGRLGDGTRINLTKMNKLHNSRSADSVVVVTMWGPLNFFEKLEQGLGISREQGIVDVEGLSGSSNRNDEYKRFGFPRRVRLNNVFEKEDDEGNDENQEVRVVTKVGGNKKEKEVKDKKEKEIKNGDAPAKPVKRVPRRLKPGVFAAEWELKWDGPLEMKTLYDKKRYLVAGLYSDFYRSGPGAIAGGSNSHGALDQVSGVEAQQAVVVREKKAAAPAPVNGMNTFKFPFPIYYGATLLETEEDFELPFDLVKFAELRASGNWTPMEVAEPKGKGGRNFTKIQKNIFVDRKPRKPKEIAICHCKVIEGPEPTGCGEGCLNRCMFIECQDGWCPCGDACTNQAFQKNNDIAGIEVFWTNGRGYGLRTTKELPASSLVIEYRGEIISSETCIERMNTIYAELENFYFLNYDNGEVIDACRKGTEARFVNHSCEPNCHIEKWSVDGEFRVGLFASKPIPAGTELTYDYRFEAFGPMQRCLCGSENCRGFIGVNKKPEAKKQEEEPTPKKHVKKKPQKISKQISIAEDLQDEDIENIFKFKIQDLQSREADPELQRRAEFEVETAVATSSSTKTPGGKMEFVWSRRGRNPSQVKSLGPRFRQILRSEDQLRSSRRFLVRNVKSTIMRMIRSQRTRRGQHTSSAGGTAGLSADTVMDYLPNGLDDDGNDDAGTSGSIGGRLRSRPLRGVAANVDAISGQKRDYGSSLSNSEMNKRDRLRKRRWQPDEESEYEEVNGGRGVVRFAGTRQSKRLAVRVDDVIIRDAAHRTTRRSALVLNEDMPDTAPSQSLPNTRQTRRGQTVLTVDDETSTIGGSLAKSPVRSSPRKSAKKDETTIPTVQTSTDSRPSRRSETVVQVEARTESSSSRSPIKAGVKSTVARVVSGAQASVGSRQSRRLQQADPSEMIMEIDKSDKAVSLSNGKSSKTESQVSKRGQDTASGVAQDGKAREEISQIVSSKTRQSKRLQSSVESSKSIDDPMMVDTQSSSKVNDAEAVEVPPELPSNARQTKRSQQALPQAAPSAEVVAPRRTRNRDSLESATASKTVDISPSAAAKENVDLNGNVKTRQARKAQAETGQTDFISEPKSAVEPSATRRSSRTESHVTKTVPSVATSQSERKGSQKSPKNVEKETLNSDEAVIEAGKESKSIGAKESSTTSGKSRRIVSTAGAATVAEDGSKQSAAVRTTVKSSRQTRRSHA
ncbi:Histone-Lysine N-Methyltransferase ash1l [Blyttiomyces sp. JEL0837]|nr:Histone-Lysine N-Methyltransferase ash1l [Blyttiomyces sp. JEL0837]